MKPAEWAAGEAAHGIEARALFTRNGGGGLCRWALQLIWKGIRDGEETGKEWLEGKIKLADFVFM